MMMVEEVLPRKRKKLPLAEAFATSFNLVDIRALKPELIHCMPRVGGCMHSGRRSDVTELWASFFASFFL